MTTAVLERPPRTLEEVAEAIRNADGDQATIDALVAEEERLERAAASRQAARRKYEALRLEWYENIAYPQFLQAQAYCGGGKMLSLLGERNTDEPSVLWTGSENDAQAWASEELKTWWLDHPRTTFRAWLRQRARGLRAQREDIEGEAVTSTEQDTPPADPQAEIRARLAARGVAPRGAAAGTVAVAEPVRLVTATAGNVVPAAFARPRQMIDGAELLEFTRAFLAHFAVWPDESTLVAATLWVAQAHARHPKTLLPVWPYAPRWLWLSKEPGSGKSQLARLMAKLSPSGQMLVEMTPAAVVEKIAKHVTLVIDETDILFGSGPRSPKIRAYINAGYEPDQTTSRMRGRTEQDIELFSQMILAGLDKVKHATGNDLDAMLSRCIIAYAKMGPPGYRPPRFNAEARGIAKMGSERLTLWMAQHVEAGIGEKIAELPEGLGNRPAALWEPLFLAAAAAGGPWPQLCAQACSDMESGAAEALADREKWQGALATIKGWGETLPAKVAKAEDDDFGFDE